MSNATTSGDAVMQGATQEEVWRDASRVFWPLFRKTTLAVVIANVLGAVLLMVVSPGSLAAMGILIAPLWGLLMGLLAGLVVGFFGMLARVGGRVAWLPFVVIPIATLLALWIGSGFVEAAWEHVDALKAELLDGPGYAGARVGHPIILLFAIPFLLITLTPLAFSVLWALLVSGGVAGIGFVAGAAVSLPPVILAVGRRLGRTAYRSYKGEEEGS